MRKHPIRHKVKSHVRKNTRVRSYVRGHGKPLTIRRKLKIRKDIKESIQAKLEKKSGFADVSIVPYINQLNKAGYETIASCSGMRKDHHGKLESAYLSVVLPEDVVTPGFGGSIHDVEPSRIKNQEYIDKLILAGQRAGWRAELSKYMMFLPTIYFTIPKTGSVGRDYAMENSPEWIAANKKLDEAKGLPPKEWLKKLDERNAIHDKILKRYGVHDKSDKELRLAWQRLTQSLLKIKKS